MVVVDAPASAAKLPLSEIPQDVKTSVDEAYDGLSAGQRVLVKFATEEETRLARMQIRSYCEGRPAGRLTASIWQGYSDPAVAGSFTQTERDGWVPALNMSFSKYVSPAEKKAALTEAEKAAAAAGKTV